MTSSEWGAFWGLTAPLAIATIAAVIDWVAVWVGGANGQRVERIAKPAVMVALLGAALVAHAWTPEAQAARPWLVLGLVASLAGDVLLLPPGRFVPGSWRSWRPISPISSRSSSCRETSRGSLPGWWRPRPSP